MRSVCVGGVGDNLQICKVCTLSHRYRLKSAIEEAAPPIARWNCLRPHLTALAQENQPK